MDRLSIGMVAFLVLFGIISIIYGLIALLNETAYPLNYFFGTLGITFGVIDLVSAYITWQTKRPRLLLFLFGFFFLPNILVGFPSMFGWGFLTALLIILLMVMVVFFVLVFFARSIPLEKEGS